MNREADWILRVGRKAFRLKKELDLAKEKHAIAKKRFREVIEICLMRGWVDELWTRATTGR